MARPLWILGLDGMEPDLLMKWASAGKLPTLAGCIERGACGRLLSTYNQLSASAWVTISTGVNPGAHGVYNFQERVPGQYRLTLPTSASRRSAAFWETAGDAGRRGLVVRVPMTYPVREFNGVGVSDWLAPLPSSPGFTSPPELASELVARFGWAFWGELWGDSPPHQAGRHAQALAQLLRSCDTSFSVFRHLLARERFDLFFGVVPETDIASHILWHFHDPSHPAHDPSAPQSLRDGLLTVYQRVDDCLGQLLEQSGFGGNLLLISDHGAGPYHCGPGCVAPLLEAAGLTIRRRTGGGGPGLLGRVKRTIGRHVPWHIRRRIKPLDEATRAQGFTAELMSDIDFARSRAFACVCIQTGEIWLNLRGREPEGIVNPGAEADELCECIRHLFMDARDPETGERPVEEVRRREELFSGLNTEVIADINVRFKEGVPVNGLTTRLPDGHEVTVKPRGDDGNRLPGFHRRHGIFVACGPDIQHTDTWVEGDLMDIAPTALALLDVPIPECAEGRALDDVLADSLRPRHTAQTQQSTNAEQAEYSDEDLARVEKRLRALGYM